MNGGGCESYFPEVGASSDEHAQTDEPVLVSTDERSGFPVISVEGRITSEDVAEVLDDE